MVQKKSALATSLEEFGLSQYESKAYVTLISKGIISASGLAYHAEIPRSKIYPILSKLEKKKLVSLSKSKPIMCTSVSPEDAFNEIIQEQSDKVKRMNTVILDLKNLDKESKKSKGIEEKRYFHIQVGNVINQLKTMIAGTKSSSSIYIITDQLGMRLFVECKKEILSALRRDIEIRMIIPLNQIGSTSFKKIIDGINIRFTEINQNCFIFNNTELLLLNKDGKGVMFSSTDVLGANQIDMFLQTWEKAIKANNLTDMTNNEAQEICKIIKIVNDRMLNHQLLNSSLVKNTTEKDKNKQYGSLLNLLNINGIDLKSKSFDEIIEIIDSILQITCSGYASFDAKNKNILINSNINGGHSLPWVSILTNYLYDRGFKLKTVYQNNNSNKGERVHIKIS